MKQFALLLFFTSLFLAAEQINPASKEHYQKGLEYYKTNDSDKARSEFLKALEADNSNEAGKKMLANLDREVYREESEDVFKDVVKELFYKGLISYRSGDKEKALKEWEKGLSLSPNNRQLKEFCSLAGAENSGNSVETEGKKEKERKKPAKKEGPAKKTVPHKEKIPVSKAKKSVDEKKVSDLYYEGVKFYQQGELKKAADIWEQVLKLDPDFDRARKRLNKAKKE
ncbi:MAG: tetratricopeptide repeat protein, partial [Candidatus Firestonebacteria bacterium]